jgi:hypothetical protein
MIVVDEATSANKCMLSLLTYDNLCSSSRVLAHSPTHIILTLLSPDMRLFCQCAATLQYTSATGSCRWTERCE